MAARRQSKAAWLLQQLTYQQRWIDEHGGDEAGYVARYGRASDPEHYGDGGEAIYAADLARHDQLVAEYRRAVVGKRCNSCGGQLRPVERLDGPALDGECRCWQRQR